MPRDVRTGFLGWCDVTWLRDELSKHRPEHAVRVAVAAILAVTGIWEAMSLWTFLALVQYIVAAVLVARVLAADEIRYHHGVPLTGVDADRAAKRAAQRFYERRRHDENR